VSDRPTRPEAEPSGAEIEITPEMIEAGVNAYLEFFVPIVEGYEGASSAMVRAVFLAMAGKNRCA